MAARYSVRLTFPLGGVQIKCLISKMSLADSLSRGERAFHGFLERIKLNSRVLLLA